MKQATPIKAIRHKCLDCSNNQPIEVKECPITECPLYYYRLGKNPNRKGTRKGNPEAFKKYRENQINSYSNFLQIEKDKSLTLKTINHTAKEIEHASN